MVCSVRVFRLRCFNLPKYQVDRIQFIQRSLARTVVSVQNLSMTHPSSHLSSLAQNSAMHSLQNLRYHSLDTSNFQACLPSKSPAHYKRVLVHSGALLLEDPCLNQQGSKCIFMYELGTS